MKKSKIVIEFDFDSIDDAALQKQTADSFHSRHKTLEDTVIDLGIGSKRVIVTCYGKNNNVEPMYGVGAKPLGFTDGPTIEASFSLTD